MNHLEKSKELGLPAEQYVLVGGSILDIYGIRTSDDIDVVVSPEAFASLKERGWEVDEGFREKWGRERLVHDVFEVYTDLHYQKLDYYLPFVVLREISNRMEGVHVQPLGLLLLGKLDNARPKDLADVALIEQYFAQQSV